MTKNSRIGKLYLEGLMSRAEILFVSAYRFRGDVAIHSLRHSYQSIVEVVDKLNHQLDYRSQDDFDWRLAEGYGDCFHVLEAEDLDDELQELAKRGFDIRRASRNHPMNLVVIKSCAADSADQFMVAMLCSHEHVDARSAETVFHLILDHYNATMTGDAVAAGKAKRTASQLSSLDATAMVQKLAGKNYDLDSNVAALTCYPTADIGGYGVEIDSLDQHLPAFRQRQRKPLSCVVNAATMIARCRQQFPEVTKNAVITAVLHKAIYNINVSDKGKPEKHLVSGRMVADLLSPQQRQQYLGNYIAFVPVSTAGHTSIERTAKAIHERIVLFKQQQQDLSSFELVELAAKAKLVGTADDDLSYVITNWNNYRYLNGEEMLADCETLAHRSAVNVDPQDHAGAALVNRAIVVVNLSDQDELCLSMFPSLRSDEENKRLISEVERLFEG